jgi:hypothetical protein
MDAVDQEPCRVARGENVTDTLDPQALVDVQATECVSLDGEQGGQPARTHARRPDNGAGSDMLARVERRASRIDRHDANANTMLDPQGIKRLPDYWYGCVSHR